MIYLYYTTSTQAYGRITQIAARNEKKCPVYGKMLSIEQSQKKKKKCRKNTQNEKLHPGILFLTVHTGSINQYRYLTMDGDSPGFRSWAWHSHILYDYIDIYVERECKTGGWIFLMNTFFLMQCFSIPFFISSSSIYSEKCFQRRLYRDSSMAVCLLISWAYIGTQTS